MQPNAPNQNPDPYGFILNSNPKPPKKPLVNSSNMTMRIAIVSCGALILIMLLVIVTSLLGGGQKAQNQHLIDIVSAQNEIVRVSTLADQGTENYATRNFAITTRLSVQTSQQTTTTMLARRGVNEKSLTRQIAIGKNPKTDLALQEATSNNRFDETYIRIMTESLTNYQKLLSSAFGGASKAEKIQLEAMNQTVQTLKANDIETGNNTETPAQKQQSSDSSIIDNDVGTTSPEE